MDKATLKTKVIKFSKKRWKLLLAAGLVLAGLGFWRYQKIQAKKSELNFQPPVVRDLKKTLEVSGVVDAKEKANLRFAAGGKVTYLGAQEGDKVKKWQTIATIDRATLKKQLEQDFNNYLKERWDFETSQDNYDYHLETLETRRSLDQEQWDLENEVLDVEIRDIAIQNTVLSAPFAGVLVESPIDTAGVTLFATEGFELVNPETLIFKAVIDEADIAMINQGQSGKIYLDAYPEQPLSSEASYIAYKSQTSSTGTIFVVEFPIQDSTLENLLSHYRLGMNGDVEILLEEKQAVLTVPFIATRVRGDKYLVDVKTEDNEYEAREIEVGLETEDYVEVLSGLSQEDQVLIPDQD